MLTHPSRHHVQQVVTRHAHAACRLGLVASIASLAACTSVPLPPWVAGSSARTPPVFAPASGMAAPSAITIPAAPNAVQISPVLLPGMPAPPAAAAPPAPPPYNAAVAARFPAPTVIYTTPGLQAGRLSYTSQPEVKSWLREQASAALRSPGTRSAVVPIGRSQRGEEIEALILTRGAGTDPASLLATARPTVLLMAQQHGDEPAGAEALLVVARELSQGLLRPLLDSINVVIVARANPDSAETGRRLTAGGLDLNSDHLLLNTPEAQSLAQLARDYRPAVVVDAHEYAVGGRYLEKFSAIPKYDALLQYATAGNLPEFLTKAAEEWYRRPLLAALKSQALSTEWYHTTSEDPADKKVSMGGTQADSVRNINGLKNAISFLIETRGAGIGRLDIQRRVHAQVTAVSSILASTAQRTSELAQLLPYIDKEVIAMACTGEAVVEALPTPAQYQLVMLDPITGADKPLTVEWDSSLALRKIKARTRPCGYWLSEASTTAVERLRLQGVQVQRIAEPGAMLGDRYRELSRKSPARQDPLAASAAARPVTLVEVVLSRGLVDVTRGGYYVPLNQPLGNLAVAALEPDSPSSFFANALLPDLGSTVRVMSPPSIRLEELP